MAQRYTITGQMSRETIFLNACREFPSGYRFLLPAGFFPVIPLSGVSGYLVHKGHSGVHFLSCPVFVIGIALCFSR